MCFIPILLDRNKVMKKKIIYLSNRIADPFERCVICKKNTNVSRNLPIDQRYGYVIGMGQLCYECFKKLYSEREKRK